MTSHDIEIHIWADGWCKGNGTPEARAGWSVQEQTAAGTILHFQSGLVPEDQPQTNNMAEYMAIIGALRLAKNENMPYAKFVIHTDSALVIGQLSKGWRVRAIHLRRLWAEAAQLLVESNNVRMVKEPRENVVAILGH